MGEAAKPLLLEGFQTGCHVVSAHEPECSHVCFNGTDVEIVEIHGYADTKNLFSAILYLNSLVHISPVTSLQCGVESVECGVWSVKCSVK